MSDHPDSDRGEKIVHEYDGIKEADNALPNWWLAILYGTIAFGAVYWLAAESFKTVQSPRVAYDEEVAKSAAVEAARVKAAGVVTDESMSTLAKDGKTVSEGQAIFASTCVACHAANGGGGIGPNLTDEFWLHGGSPSKVYATIKDGFAAKGMPAWGGTLGEERVRTVAAYVLTLKNTKVPGGKAPQGENEP
ncbi:MAG: c-type cytochrome [Polyangiales bacterium]